MPLDPKLKGMLNQDPYLGFPIARMTPDEARNLELRMLAADRGQPEPVGTVEDRLIPSDGRNVPIRVYVPTASEEMRSSLPAFIYFHAGGWVLGSLDAVDKWGWCRQLANKVKCVVVAVNYPLAPENKFPAAVEACFAATAWVTEPTNAATIGVDPSRVAVGGDSAGGNLAAAVALMSKERHLPNLVLQALIYPLTDFHPGTDSYREFARGYCFERQTIDWCWHHYLRTNEDGGSPYASPARARDLTGLPPALVITAEFDMLRDEAEAYAGRMRQAEVPVRLRRYDGMIHGFLDLRDVVDEGNQAIRDVAASLKVAFGVRQ